MNSNTGRIRKYSKISNTFARLSNDKLKQILANATPVHEGIGGKSGLIFVDDTPVFVKKIPLTDIEQLPQNFMSTSNIFDLPLCYQYGVGSAGFGAWRELVTHITTTNWVIADECTNFPIMYHFRILPSEPDDINSTYWGDMEQYFQSWENSTVIRKRIEDLNKASTYIALFLEYVPQNLYEWLSAQITKDSESAEAAIAFVNKNLKATNTYMHKHGMLHFDTHFENILTDGERLYFTDFGLASSLKFDLSETEAAFLKNHHQYDFACAGVNLLHCIITSLFGREQWEIRLRECLAGDLNNVPPAINRIINQYAPMALLMDEFFQKLQKESKSTPYPALQVEKLLNS